MPAPSPRPSLTELRLKPCTAKVPGARLMHRLVEAQLADDPRRGALAAQLTGQLTVIYTDLKVEISLCFERGSLAVVDGFHGIPDATLEGTGQAVLDMCRLPGSARSLTKALKEAGSRRELRQRLLHSPVIVRGGLRALPYCLATQALLANDY